MEADVVAITLESLSIGRFASTTSVRGTHIGMLYHAAIRTDKLNTQTHH